MLQPLAVGAPDYERRSALVVAALVTDLLGRVLVDKDDVKAFSEPESRHTHRFACELRTDQTPGVDVDNVIGY